MISKVLIGSALITAFLQWNKEDKAMKWNGRRKRINKVKNWRKEIQSHMRRTLLEIINVLGNHDWVFRLFGFVNGYIGIVQSVFLVYPASEKYGLAYAYSRRLRKNVWEPWLTGLLCQNGRCIVMFAISATNEQILNKDNSDGVRHVAERMETISRALGANRKTFAGILPGVLHVKRIIDETPEADITAAIVSQAVHLVKIKESLGDETPIIVLGGKGFIGRRVVKMLGKSNVHSIDLADGQDKNDWPDYPEEVRAIVVNIATQSALREYIDVVRSGTVIINEVYPEPARDTVNRLVANNCNCYHIAGVDAKAFPSFPSVYGGAIPCCAALPSENMKVTIRKLG